MLGYDYSRFNWNEPITRKDIDMDIYNRKFELANKVFFEDKNPHPKVVQTLLKDRTIRIFLKFKINGKPIRLFPFQDIIANDPHRFRYFRAANQIGKALWDNSKVITKDGFKFMKHIVEGDMVAGEDGNFYEVIKKTQQGKRHLYKLTFDDDSSYICDKEHLIKYIHPKFRFKHKDGRKANENYNRYQVDTLSNIIHIDGFNPRPIKRIAIPVCEPVTWDEKDVPIHPYIIGVLLGDGCLTKGTPEFYSVDKELVDNVKKYIGPQFKLRRMKHPYGYSIVGNMGKVILRLGINHRAEGKNIPSDYLFNSIDNRIFLLRGLMDTDGSIYGKGSCEFCTVSRELADDIKLLVMSLGGKAKIKEKETGFQKAYRVFIKLEHINPFMLSRKANKHYKIRYRKERILRNIEYFKYDEASCIVLDSEDKTFLTDDFIVTHNSEMIDCEAADDLTIDHGFEFNSAIVSQSLKQATFQMLRIKDRLNSANIFDWAEEKGEIDNMSMLTWNVPDTSKPKRNGVYPKKYTNRVIVVPAGEGILGFDLHSLYLDEFEFWRDIDRKWFVNQLAEPRTYATHGKLTFTTNPNGADDYGAELEKLKMKNGISKYHTYIFNFLDRPGNTEEHLEEAKIGKSRAEIESTLLAIRSLSDRNYFTREEIERSMDKNLNSLSMVGKQPFFFLDVGAKHDQSVLVGGYVEYPDGEEGFAHIYVPLIITYPVGYPITRVVGAEVEKSDGWHYEKSVKEHLEEWRVDGIEPVFGVDVTGNSGISPLFETVGIYAEDVTFSGPSKSGMYQRLKYFMEKGLLHRIRNESFDYQFSHLEMKKSKRGYLMIHHEQEEDLDDIPDAIAGLIYLADPAGPSIVKPSLEMI